MASLGLSYLEVQEGLSVKLWVLPFVHLSLCKSTKRTPQLSFQDILMLANTHYDMVKYHGKITIYYTLLTFHRVLYLKGTLWGVNKAVTLILQIQFNLSNIPYLQKPCLADSKVLTLLSGSRFYKLMQKLEHNYRFF